MAPVAGASVRLTRHSRFKLCIAGFTVLLLTAIVSLTPSGRYVVSRVWYQAAMEANRGKVRSIEENIREQEEMMRLELNREAVQVARTVDKDFNRSPEGIQRFRRLAGLAPGGSPEETAVIAKGINLSCVAVLSGKVFTYDAAGPQALPYVLRPNRRSVWLGSRNPIAQREMLSVPLLPDDPELREAAEHHTLKALRGANLAGRPHTTNSWGLRGSEPDPNAPNRVMVLGDSYMHGFGVGDHDTPAMFLERHLADTLKEHVCVLNASVSGYGPMEYYLSLEKFADRFNPHIVVVSLCSNDFGQSNEVYDENGQAVRRITSPIHPGRTASLLRSGDDWQRAGFYLRKIRSVCQAREIRCLFCPAPEAEFMRRRKASYTDRLAQLLQATSLELFSTIDALTTENLRILEEHRAAGGEATDRSFLHLEDEGDGHLNPRGADIWGREVARRVAILIKLGGA